MKKNYICFLLLSICAFLTQGVYAQDAYVRCATHGLTNEILKNDPEARARVQELEAYTSRHTQSNKRGISSIPQKRIIPVVVHIIHANGPENISNEQVYDAIRILNRDFQKQNADTAEVKLEFRDIIGNPNVEFRLAKLDPNGNCTDGITRHYSLSTLGGTDIASNDPLVKAVVSWDSRKYLNIYVVKNVVNAGAYAYLPGTWPAGSNRDGIVCRYTQFGGIGPSSGGNLAARTLTHETGHYMNLRHVWGSTNTPGLASNCNDDDGVDDTPNTIGNQFGCNKDVVSCGTLDNVENYMDYAECERMFTFGQVDRMDAAMNSVASGRNGLWAPSNLVATGVNDGFVANVCIPKPEFNVVRVVCAGSSITFKDNSWNAPVDEWTWTLEGADTMVYHVQNPVVMYSTPGTYRVKLKVANASGADSIVLDDYITVFENPSSRVLPYTQDFSDRADVDDNVFVFSDQGPKWEYTTAASYSDSASFSLRLFNTAVGVEDAFMLPTLNLTGYETPTLRFKLAYARRTTASSDQLKIDVSRNCGVIYTARYTKSGAQLATTSNVVNSFVPTNASQWREETVSLSSVKNAEAAFIRFTVTSGNGNNIYVDDIEVYDAAAVGIDRNLAEQINLAVYPNPVQDISTFRFTLQKPSAVKMSLLDITGRELSTLIEGNYAEGDQTYTFDRSSVEAPGMYLLHLTVDGYSVNKKVLIY